MTREIRVEVDSAYAAWHGHLRERVEDYPTAAADGFEAAIFAILVELDERREAGTLREPDGSVYLARAPLTDHVPTSSLEGAAD